MKYLAIAIGVVIAYYAYLVSQSHDAMLFAAGLAVGVFGFVAGAVVVVFAVRYAAPRQAQRREPSGDVIDGFTAMPQLTAGKPQPQFRDAGSVQVIGVPQEVQDDAWR